MKNILICSATYQEIKPFLQWLKYKHSVEKISKNYFITSFNQRYKIHILISGVGMVSMAYHLAEIKQQIDFAINVGIAGAFDREFEIGEIVIVKKDILSELGAEDKTRFIKASELKLADETIIPKRLFIPETYEHLKQVNAITVNTVHGNQKNVKRVRDIFNPQIESMEGAAFYFACNQKKWKSLQLRSISNYVERRNKSKWNIPLAIHQLNNILIQYIQTL